MAAGAAPRKGGRYSKSNPIVNVRLVWPGAELGSEAARHRGGGWRPRSAGMLEHVHWLVGRGRPEFRRRFHRQQPSRLAGNYRWPTGGLTRRRSRPAQHVVPPGPCLSGTHEAWLNLRAVPAHGPVTLQHYKRILSPNTSQFSKLGKKLTKSRDKNTGKPQIQQNQKHQRDNKTKINELFVQCCLIKNLSG